MKKIHFALLLLILTSLPLKSWAFPELIRHGYASCLACHVSPTGGGLLNDYGRELSRELVSTWGGEKESQFAYGAFETPHWLQLGGHYRVLQVVQEDPDTERATFFNMQADLEAGILLGPFSLVGTIGRDTSRSGDDGIFSRRHYLSYRVNNNIMVRGGRFYPEFGLNIPDHRRSTRSFYGFDAGQETYNAELSWMNETIGLFGTGIFGRPFEDDEVVQSIDNQGFALSGHVFLWESWRIGGSARFLSGDLADTQAFSGFLIAGFSKNLYLMGELIFGVSEDADGTVNSLANFAKLNWEITRGFHVYGIQEFHRADVDDNETDTAGFGGGIQFLPRPHLEAQVEYQKRRTPQLVSFSEDLFYLMLHFYL